MVHDLVFTLMPAARQPPPSERFGQRGQPPGAPITTSALEDGRRAEFMGDEESTESEQRLWHPRFTDLPRAEFPDTMQALDDDHNFLISSNLSGAPHRPPIPEQAYRPPRPSRPTARMLVRKIPSDTTHDELWRHFSQLPSRRVHGRASVKRRIFGGVVSVYLLRGSRDAFVDFESEDYLRNAVSRFHGLTLRPGDLLSPPLVCRSARKVDDRKLSRIGAGTLLAAEAGRQRRNAPNPRRYFVMTAVGNHVANRSLQQSVWATERRYEPILDHAYRTSKDVILIFKKATNQQFYGCARIIGPVIDSSDSDVSWQDPDALFPVADSAIFPGARGRDFHIDWISTYKLKFKRVQNLLDADQFESLGDCAEIDPSLGRKILDKWGLHDIRPTLVSRNMSDFSDSSSLNVTYDVKSATSTEARVRVGPAHDRSGPEDARGRPLTNVFYSVAGGRGSREKSLESKTTDYSIVKSVKSQWSKKERDNFYQLRPGTPFLR